MRSARLAKSIPFVAIAIAAYSCAHGIDNGLNGVDTSGPGVGVGIGGFGGDLGTMAGPGAGGGAGDVPTATGPAVTTAGVGGSSGGSTASTSSVGGGGMTATTSVGMGGSGGIAMDASAGSAGAAGAGKAGAGGNAGAAGNTGTAGSAGGGVDAAPDVREAAVDAPPEASCGSPAQCALKPALVHRYTFAGTGTAVTDSVGTANGTVVGATLAGNGTLALAGGTSNQYVNFPNGMIKALTNATFEFWITWNGGSAWQRVFDFGDTTPAAEDTQGTPATSFYLTPLGGGPTVMFAAFKRADQTGPMETRAVAAAGLATGTMIQLTVVVDDANNQLRLYRNGAADGTVALADSLTTLNDVNVWLGRSQYNDPEFGGIFHEFRIYNVALTQAQIQAAFAGGTDPAFLN